MLVLITYDVATETEGGQKRLRQVARVCKNYGQRVQKSVFECLVDPTKWTIVRERLIDKIDIENDSLRFYFLGKNWRGRIEHVGVGQAYDPEGPLIT
nr:CRISPR-associated endonuclease Cas2 [Dehalococcoides mccartyi]